MQTDSLRKNLPIRLDAANYFLRPITEADVSDTYLGWLRDPEVNRYLESRFSQPNLASLAEYVRGFDHREHFLWGLFTKSETPLHIGNFAVLYNSNNETAYFGYLIGDKNYWGTSAATEALCSIFEFVFRCVGARKMWGGAMSSNMGSIFNFHKFGFVREGVQRKHYLDGGRAVDGYIYGLLREEWEAKRKTFAHVDVKFIYSDSN